MRRLIVALACRNNGSRLYGKPLQNLCVIDRYTVLDNIVASLKGIDCIDQIVVGIADTPDNLVYERYCIEHDLQFIWGDEVDVLERLISCANAADATDVLRITSESPFPYYPLMNYAWKKHVESKADATFLDDIVDGCGFEIISKNALMRSHNEGSARHRSELCSLYIRENRDRFIINKIESPKEFYREDIRLTIDNPEDLIVCRAIYQEFKSKIPQLDLSDIINFLDQNPKLKELTLPYCADGYASMYL